MKFIAFPSTDKHWQACSARIICENDNNRVAFALHYELSYWTQHSSGGGGARGRDLSNLKMEQTHPEFGGWRMPAAKLLLFDRSALHCY